MQAHIDALLARATQALAQAHSIEALELLRVSFLGKKGELTELLKQISTLPIEERPVLGKSANLAKQAIADAIAAREQELSATLQEAKLAKEQIDITLPGRRNVAGSLHPITHIQNKVIALFQSVGFRVVDGPEIEDDFHNFEALNIPATHPAREMQDTFYLKKTGCLLRTHTSSVQIRTMEKEKPPLRLIALGRVYRKDSDRTHTPMFHQMEGLWIDTTASFAGLKGLLHDFLKKLFGEKVEIRFRASYFPFTEPSAEVDIRISHLNQGNWLEVLGCGMVHPNVLRNVNIDSETYQGFAFGVGLDRLAMLLYGIPDLRLLFENDLRFLSEFA